MNKIFPTAMPTSNSHCVARDVSEDENEDCFVDVSKIFYHLNRDVFHDDSFHLISHDYSLSSLDITTVEEDSLEPTPIRPDGILSVYPQNTAFLLPRSTTVPLIHEMTIKRDHSSWTGIASNSNVALEPNRLVLSLESDPEACFIRPSKIARMTCSSPFAESPLGGFGGSTNPVYHDSSSSLVHKTAATPAVSLDLEVSGTGIHSTKNTCLGSKSPVSGKKTIIRNHTEISDNDNDNVNDGRFRAYQSDQWMERYDELKAYSEEFGHCVVPHNYLHHGSPALVSLE
jgi:Helicase associated domain